MSRKYLLDCSASGAKWADDVHWLEVRFRSDKNSENASTAACDADFMFHYNRHPTCSPSYTASSAVRGVTQSPIT